MNPADISGWVFFANKTQFKQWHQKERLAFPGAPKEYPCWAKQVFDSGSDTSTDFLYHNELAYMLAAFVQAQPGERPRTFEAKHLIRRVVPMPSGAGEVQYLTGYIKMGGRKVAGWSNTRPNAWPVPEHKLEEVLRHHEGDLTVTSEPL